MRVVDVPRDVSKSLRKIAGENSKHIPVQGQVEGLPLKSTLSPRGGGSYRLHIHSNIWRKLHIDAGDSVEVMLQVDREPRDPALPHDFAGGLAEEPRALATFNSLTPALRSQIVPYVDMAKHANAREKRIRLMVKRMLERAARRKKKKIKQSRLIAGSGCCASAFGQQARTPIADSRKPHSMLRVRPCEIQNRVERHLLFLAL